jgi:hypothetical protein
MVSENRTYLVGGGHQEDSGQEVEGNTMVDQSLTELQGIWKRAKGL